MDREGTCYNDNRREWQIKNYFGFICQQNHISFNSEGQAPNYNSLQCKRWVSSKFQIIVLFSYLHTFSKKVEYTRGIRTDKKPMDGISKTINWIKNFVFRKVPSGDVVYCFRRSSQPYEVSSIDCLDLKNDHCTKKMKFSIKDFFSKCDQIRSFLRIWSHLLKKSLMENFILCAVDEVLTKPQEVVNADATHSTFKVDKVVLGINKHNKFFNLFFHLIENSQRFHTQYYGLNYSHNSADQQSDGVYAHCTKEYFSREE